MFDALPASKPLDRIRPPSALLASVIHGAILTAVLATRAAPSLLEPARERPLIFHTVIPPAAPRDPIVVGEPVPAAPGRPPLLIPPLVVPPVPPVGLSRTTPPLDLRSLVNHRIGESPVSTGGNSSIPQTASTPLTAAEVDEPVTVLGQAQPRYPPALAEAGISGRVILEFVVDANGAVDSPSLRVVSSSHGGFNEAASEAIRATHFRPARYQGSRVRQLVRRTVRFIAAP